MTNFYKQILKRVNVYFLLFSLNLIDILTVGSILFTNKLNGLQDEILSQVTSVLHLISLIFGQINHNMFTGIPTGICSTIIVEASVLFSGIYLVCLEKYSKEKALVNTLFIISFSTLMLGLFSFFFSMFDIDYYVQAIPLELVNGILAGSGLSMIFISRSLFLVEDIILSNLMFIFTFGIVILIFYIEKKYSNIHFVPIIVVLTFFLIYRLYKFILNENPNIKPRTSFINSVDLLLNLQFNLIDLNNLLEFFPKILSLTCFCLIFLPFNLIVYNRITKVKISSQREMKTQGMSNILGSIFCLPTYFVCSHSITFYKSSCSTQPDSMILALCYFLILFIADTIKSIAPIQILAIFPLMVGLSLCKPALYLPKSLRNFYELIFTWGIAFLIGFNYSIPLVFLLGMLIALLDYLFVQLFYKSHEPSNTDIQSLFSSCDVLIIDYPLFFLNINKFLREITKIKKKEVLIDLNKCTAFDSLGNDVFINNLYSDKMYYLIGNPFFVEINEIFKDKSNVMHFKNHYDAIKYKKGNK
ncbi:sulfate permease [Tubulinosema ratisbonensis]|uniref:Sulfate permease n=1 Tax=Tubulinosema ratisbonensis TaxID=291195 RepID=A0A437ALI6_9MICR|nr:sulfate permease [Tubulinosema ratisbonensis]